MSGEVMRTEIENLVRKYAESIDEADLDLAERIRVTTDEPI
jgi:hypothetical protein